MNVLFATSEMNPFVKSGGLADVSGALPKALKKRGVNIRVILPKYSIIAQKYLDKLKHICHFEVQLGWRKQYCGLEVLDYDGIKCYFIDNEYYFKRSNLYGDYDDGEKMAYFSKAVLEAIKHMPDFEPEIIHCNDWHTALIPVLLKEQFHFSQKHKNIKTILTIHNLKFQGIFDRYFAEDVLGLDKNSFASRILEWDFDKINCLKGGIMEANIVTTVSPTYSSEIKTPFYGENLNEIMSMNNEKLLGIVNGIDYEQFNPNTDKQINKTYSESKFFNKSKNKVALQKKLGLRVSQDIPMVTMVSRLTEQKGLDLVLAIIEEVLSYEVQFVVLGTGEQKYEEDFANLGYRYGNNQYH